MRRCNALGRDYLPTGTLLVALDRILYTRWEIIPDDFETSFSGWDYVTGPVFFRGIGIVNDCRLLGPQARLKDYSFPIPGSEHVEVDSHVGIGKPFLVERRFSGSLDSDEENQFHDQPDSGQSVFGRRRCCQALATVPIIA